MPTAKVWETRCLDLLQVTGWQRTAMGWLALGWGPLWGTYGFPVAAQVTTEHKRDALRRQAGYFEKALTEIKKRIEELEDTKA